MDEATNNLVSKFADFMEKEFQTNKYFKDFKTARITHWSLKEFRITLDVEYEDNRYKLYFDVRELKDNPDHFSHLSGNALDQFKALVE